MVSAEQFEYERIAAAERVKWEVRRDRIGNVFAASVVIDGALAVYFGPPSREHVVAGVALIGMAWTTAIVGFVWLYASRRALQAWKRHMDAVFSHRRAS